MTDSAWPHAAVQALVLVRVVEHLLMRTLVHPGIIGGARGDGGSGVRLELAAHVFKTGAGGNAASWERGGRGIGFIFLEGLDGR